MPSPDADALISRAEALATRAHAGQVDKAGTAYIEHPRAVARIVQRDHPGQAAAIAIAWLHDVVEDTDVELDTIRADFGDEIANGVDAMTRRDDEEPDDYYARVAANRLALAVKRADIENNTDPARTALLESATRARLAAKYEHAIAVLSQRDKLPR
ncbi:MAG: phosphohydrolase [Actinobacteria bacterium 69-20]|nr:bifunctional (p)ppGpp synthetase/guanosine-3',5'-bis(diphosphate) 3'-pyrophosphohydrolase [Actinomycetota bacterium]OJV27912.1 MAG: phosphohydrolase [Actinobacteria bacterium 69-20]